MRYVLILFLLFGCGTIESTSETKEKSISNTLEKQDRVIKTVLPSINTYLYDLEDLKVGKTINTPSGTNISIVKDSATNTLKIQYETLYDTVYEEKIIEIIKSDTIYKEKNTSETIKIKNNLNWQIPLILLIIIGILIFVLKL